MKKLLLTTCFAFYCIAVFAQNYGDNDNPITYGLMGGSNFAFLQIKSQNRQYVSTDSESPFSLGLNADFKFNDYFSIRPAIFYCGKGGSMNAVYTNDKGNVSANDEYILHYLEIPLQFVGHLPVGDGANIFLGGGPFYSYALSGKNTQTLYTADPTVQHLTFGNSGDFKSSDFGVTSVIGFQGAKGWSISGNLEFGLTNILQNNNTGFDASQMKTITFYLSIGQSF